MNLYRRAGVWHGSAHPLHPCSHASRPIPVVNNYYTLRALVREWQPDLEGTTVRDVYSQNKNELTVALGGTERD